MTPASSEDRTNLPAGEPAPDKARLLVFVDGVVTTHDLPDRGMLVVGRSESCDIQVSHPSVSRQHARLQLGDGVQVEDLASSFGTRIAGTPVTAGRATPLPAGVALELGAALLLYQPARSAPEPTSTPSGTTFWQRIETLVELVAKSALSVLILGETGVGKDVMARLIVERSPRAQSPYLRINCAALPENLLEAELFGYERGAFTGALQPKPGLLEAAHHGTVLLDEIGELPPAAQAKLLRALESREVMRLGSVEPRPIDVRFLAATNRDLPALVAAGRFREDLLYRLNGMSIVIPPLRERTNEIADLAKAFLDEARRKSGKPPLAIAAQTLERLRAHPWRGNVRELLNVMERAAVLCQESVLTPTHVDLSEVLAVTNRPPPSADSQLPDEIEALERKRIVEALDRAAGNQTKAAQLLGISRRTLLRRLDHFQLARPRKP